MKLELDENLPASLASSLSSLGYDVDTVLDEGLKGRPDTDVWRAAQTEDRLLVTQDLDFSDQRQFEPGTHAGVVIVRIPDEQQRHIGRFVTACFSSSEARSWSGCLVIATPNKLRVRRPL